MDKPDSTWPLTYPEEPLLCTHGQTLTDQPNERMDKMTRTLKPGTAIISKATRRPGTIAQHIDGSGSTARYRVQFHRFNHYPAFHAEATANQIEPTERD